MYFLPLSFVRAHLVHHKNTVDKIYNITFPTFNITQHDTKEKDKDKKH